jgi:hypothetical protein
MLDGQSVSDNPRLAEHVKRIGRRLRNSFKYLDRCIALLPIEFALHHTIQKSSELPASLLVARMLVCTRDVFGAEEPTRLNATLKAGIPAGSINSRVFASANPLNTVRRCFRLCETLLASAAVCATFLEHLSEGCPEWLHQFRKQFDLCRSVESA